MGHNKFSKLFKNDTRLYLWIIGFMVFIIALYEPFLGVVGLLLLIYLIYYNWRSGRQKNKRWQQYIETLSSDIDSAARYAILNLPIPLTLVDLDGKLSWYNSKFADLVDQKDLLGAEIDRIVPMIEFDRLLKGEDAASIKIGENIFRVLSNVVKIATKDDERYIMMLYWIDQTDFHNLFDQYNDEKPVVALIQVDNLDDVINETKEEFRPAVRSEIDKRINLWATRMNALIKRYSSDKYLVVFSNRFLDNLEAKRFAILDDIREIEVGNKIPVTLSVGVGTGGKNLSQMEENAFSALELALGRGGDQAVVRKEGNYEFYGGKTKAVEKRNRVKARVIAHAFRPLIDDCSRVFIMGHRFPDMDAYGAAIGVYRAVLNRGKDAYIILNDINEAIVNVHDVFKDNDTYHFITTDEALEMIEEDALIVVVDTHRPSFTEAPAVLNTGAQIVMIDHHRRGTEFIDNAVLKYTEPYASSTSELVTEILQYMEDTMRLEKQEAEALLAGITVDTKNFTFQTGVRTFEAASLLRRFGADTTVVRQLFQDDLSTFIHKSNIVRNAKIFDNDVAISVYDEDVPNAQLVAAQGADDLLNIRGISTSFVIGRKSDEMIFISGRSLGETNVQVILEKIGGGGHMTVAGAQFEGKTIDEVKDMLLKAVQEYFDEEGE